MGFVGNTGQTEIQGDKGLRAKPLLKLTEKVFSGFVYEAKATPVEYARLAKSFKKLSEELPLKDAKADFKAKFDKKLQSNKESEFNREDYWPLTFDETINTGEFSLLTQDFKDMERYYQDIKAEEEGETKNPMFWIESSDELDMLRNAKEMLALLSRTNMSDKRDVSNLSNAVDYFLRSYNFKTKSWFTPSSSILNELSNVNYALSKIPIK